MNAADLLTGQRVVPVVVIDDAGDAVPLAKTLLDSGLNAIEVTLRTKAGLDAIDSKGSNVFFPKLSLITIFGVPIPTASTAIRTSISSIPLDKT